MTTPIKPSNQSPVDEFVAECQKTFERYVSHAHAASSESGFVQQAADRIPVDNWFLDSVEQALSRDASHESKYRFREKVLFDYVYRAISNEEAYSVHGFTGSNKHRSLRPFALDPAGKSTCDC